MAQVKQKLLVSAGDPIKFTETIIDLASKGAKLKPKSYVFVKHYPLHCEMEIYVEADEQLESTPNVTAIPVPVSFTKEELEAMEWEQLKDVCKTVGITGRNRDKLVKDYLSAMSKAGE